MENYRFVETVLSRRQLISSARLEKYTNTSLGIGFDGKALEIPFYNKNFYVTLTRMEDSKRDPPSEAV